MITCPKCRQANPEGSKICGSCGAQLAEIIFCPSCGQKTISTFAFCQNCGSRVKPETSPAIIENPDIEKQDTEKVRALDTRIRKLLNKIPKKVLIGSGIAATAVIALVLSIGIFMSSSSKDNYGLYMKDAELFYTDFSKEGNLEVTSRLLETDYTDKELASLTLSIGAYVAFNESCSRLFFPDRIDDNSGIVLYYCDVKKTKDPAVKVDADVTSYAINDAGTGVIYLKGDEGNLYIHDLEEKERIASGVEEFYVTDDLKKVVYRDDENSCYVWSEKGESTKITGEMMYIAYVSEDLETVYYVKDQSLYKYTDNNKEKEKIAADIASVIKIYESGEIYYSTKETQIIKMMDYVNDDMAVSDASVTKPDYPKYPDAPKYPYAWNYTTTEEYDAARKQYKADYAAYQAERERLSEEYQQAYDVYMKKVQRDNLRDVLAGSEYEMKEYGLFYYDGKESMLVNDSMKSAYVSEYALKSAVCVFSKYDKSDIKRFKISELSSASDVKNEVLRALTSSHAVQIAIGAESYEIEQVSADYFAISADGSEMYFLDEVNGEGAGDLYKLTIQRGKISTPELYDNDVYKYNKGFVSEKDFIYYKNVNADKVVGDLYVNGKEVGYEVYMYALTCTDDVIMYYTDWNHDKSYGTLRMYNGKDNTKIADDVYAFCRLKNGNVMYLHDYSVNHFIGTLYLYKDGKTEKIDDDVIALVTELADRIKGAGAYGW